jgi:CBS domain-containing protein/RNA polymerase-binding transcription factor DksA
MTPDPARIGPTASAREAITRMVDRGIRHLPVVDEKDRVIGVVSVDDLRAALPWEPGTQPAAGSSADETAREWKVAELMTHAPLTAQENTSLADAAETMARWRIGCLPVVDEEQRLVGILSETDLLHALTNTLWARRVDDQRARKADLQQLLEQLRRERDALAERLGHYREREREIAEELRVQEGDGADLGSNVSELSLTESLDAHAHARLRAIGAALGRAASQGFGRCERCGEPIPTTRLRALPTASLCVGCARA